MFSQNGFYILLSGVVSSIISGTLLLISTSNNNKFQLEREKQQRIWQEENDQKKWYREKIYDSYKTSFQVLVKIQQEQIAYMSNDETSNVIPRNKHFNNMINLILEFKVEFSVITANHPDKRSKEFLEKVNTINKSLEKESWKIQSILIEIMESDSRIKDKN